MALIEETMEIKCSPEKVFAYVTDARELTKVGIGCIRRPTDFARKGRDRDCVRRSE